MDLLVLVADGDQKAVFDGLLENRTKSIGIRLINFRVDKHPNRDPGVYATGAAFCRELEANYRFSKCLIVLDEEWEGSPGIDAIKEKIVEDCRRIGIAAQVEVLVISPEIEQWVWQPSLHVLNAIGREESYEEIRSELKQFWPDGSSKPLRPKEAFDAARSIPRSSSIFYELANIVSLKNCQDAEFNKFLKIIRAWFPVSD
ncbi:hypothetical protein HNQ07_003306 [Deinococcus metalli]|uniref:DUF4276 family protein n=1 Tax=Deinococcus metalli TaxID=1141878 RepID=A0A7W8KIX1_9DEIO|nr:hypothetical protein [Deinococcus metalli]MBB5377806.1 hypothetical protein [Deinococcus metalli]GHF55802.1 hypothetical protein GCM10017781_35270 [Deinococcus metalli]